MTRPTAPRALLVSVAAGLLMHGVLLQGFAAGDGFDEPEPAIGALPPVQLRSVSAPLPPVMTAPPAARPERLDRAASRARMPVASSPAQPAEPAPSARAPLADAAPSAEGGLSPEHHIETVVDPLPDAAVPNASVVMDADTAVLVAAAGVSASTTASAPTNANAVEPLPSYRTSLPPPVTLRYGAQSGRLSGTAELVWAPNATRYEARLETRVSGITVLTWRSEGAFDAAGIAPERFTDERRLRSAQAANFRRDSARITFSGPSNEYPLHAGTQDRLTWLLQVPGIVAANPQRFKAGSQIRLFVVGARGDADVWVLQVKGSDALQLADGRSVRALRIAREATGEYATRAEVWLDPTRHHLPVKLLIGNQALELLDGLPAPP